MSKLLAGLIVWYVGWIGLGFLPAELVAHFWKGCPWPTFSSTNWDIEKDWEPWKLAIEAFGVVLIAHLVWKLSAAALIAVAVCAVVALVVHFATAAL